MKNKKEYVYWLICKYCQWKAKRGKEPIISEVTLRIIAKLPRIIARQLLAELIVEERISYQVINNKNYYYVSK